MNTCAAASIFGARPSVVRQRRTRVLDEEAKIFLVGELVVAVVALAAAGVGWLIFTVYDEPWALWQSRMMLVVAGWAVYLVLRAWLSRDLHPRDESTRAYEFSAGD